MRVCKSIYTPSGIAESKCEFLEIGYFIGFKIKRSRSTFKKIGSCLICDVYQFTVCTDLYDRKG